MTFQSNHAEFRVTQTQKLIAAKALEAVTQHEVHPDHPMIEIIARAIVVLQRGGMGSYYDHGLRSSHFSRLRREPLQVAQEINDVDSKVEAFAIGVEGAEGEAARRIRANRARRERERMRELEQRDNDTIDCNHLSILNARGLLS